jgi:hypothetical protein
MCSGVDAAPVRPPEPAIAIVDQQAHAGKPGGVGRHQVRRAIRAAIVDHDHLVGDRQRIDRARHVLERLEDVLGLAVRRDDDGQRPRRHGKTHACCSVIILKKKPSYRFLIRNSKGRQRAWTA